MADFLSFGPGHAVRRTVIQVTHSFPRRTLMQSRALCVATICVKTIIQVVVRLRSKVVCLQLWHLE